MTDSELIKALENSINTYNQKGIYVDTENIQQQVLDLIKRQRAEIEKLKGSTIVSNIMGSQRIKREAYKEFLEKAAIELTNAYSSDYAHWIDDTLNNLLEKSIGDNK